MPEVEITITYNEDFASPGVDFKRISEGSFRRGEFRRRMTRRTPMDALLGQAERLGFDRVEVRIGDSDAAGD